MKPRIAQAGTEMYRGIQVAADLFNRRYPQDKIFEFMGVAGVPTWEMAQRGIAMVPEGRMIFRDLSIEAKLMPGAFAKTRRAGAVRQIEEVYARFPLLKERRALPGGARSRAARRRCSRSGAA